ncbi:MAG: hypothetical protein R3C56_04845 [Pirellulaceae bacterium]
MARARELGVAAAVDRHRGTSAALLDRRALLCRWTAHRLLYPPDVGSEGKDVVDLEEESRNAIGMVIQRDQFPDRLFAPRAVRAHER